MGYGLVNDNPLHRAVALYGTGRNGKGTFPPSGAGLAGRKLCGDRPESLDENRFRSAELFGQGAEFDWGCRPRTFPATEMFKQVTGGDVSPPNANTASRFNFSVAP